MHTAIVNVIISQIDSNGNTLESWKLHAPFIKSVKYGELDYENDELTQIELGIRYDWAECTIGGAGTAAFSEVTA